MHAGWLIKFQPGSCRDEAAGPLASWGFPTAFAGVALCAGSMPGLKAVANIPPVQCDVPIVTEGRDMDDAIRTKILTLLDQHRIMTIATLRPDGWPQTTTVGYVNDGLTLYFLCGLDSQKAANLTRDDRVSLTIDHDTPDLMAITGLSMAARAQAVTSRAEAEQVLRLLPLKYPDSPPLPMPMPTPEEVRIFRVTPAIISVLDYSKGFGHTDLITC
jgi:nitroimidazol reductase NimA-like FMN-containing flavoprotein (pyridoxamine 5'-phosphate oxidase superfamily)